MDEQIKPVAWIMGNVSFGPYDFRKTEPRGWGYSEPLIKLSEHRAAIDALRAEVEALRADAERYRWLKVNDNAFLLAEDIIDDQLDIDAARKGAGTDVRYTVTAKGREMLGARNGG